MGNNSCREQELGSFKTRISGYLVYCSGNCNSRSAWNCDIPKKAFLREEYEKEKDERENTREKGEEEYMRRKREGMSEAQWKLNMVAVIVLMIVYLIVTLYNSERLAAQTEKNVEPSIRDGGCERES